MKSNLKKFHIHLEELLIARGILERKENSFFPALNTIGYGQIQSFLKNEISFEKMKENIFIKTRQFAKRQIQWFNRENAELIIKMDDLKMDEIIQILCGIFKVMI